MLLLLLSLLLLLQLAATLAYCWVAPWWSFPAQYAALPLLAVETAAQTSRVVALGVELVVVVLVVSLLLLLRRQVSAAVLLLLLSSGTCRRPSDNL